MYKFYFTLWLGWALRLTFSSILYASVVAFIITVFVFTQQNEIALNKEIYIALFDIFTFWFMLFWNLALLLALFRGMKYLFNSCKKGFILELLTCPQENIVSKIELVGYGDLVQVWRKWFMLLIWLVGAQMVIAVIINRLFFPSSESLFQWFSIYILYGFILLAGFASFIILPAKCKRVRISKC